MLSSLPPFLEVSAFSWKTRVMWWEQILELFYFLLCPGITSRWVWEGSLELWEFRSW